jgi:Holliday junction resolvasome RuvABC ATP-dependent DNA helicase subunit
VSGTIFAAGTVCDILVRWRNALMDVNPLQINCSLANRTTPDAAVPLMPNSSMRFTGQTETLSKLKEHFSDTNTDSKHLRRKYFLLYGMGGIGKTQICLKFMEEMSDQ